MQTTQIIELISKAHVLNIHHLANKLISWIVAVYISHEKTKQFHFIIYLVVFANIACILYTITPKYLHTSVCNFRKKCNIHFNCESVQVSQCSCDEVRQCIISGQCGVRVLVQRHITIESGKPSESRIGFLSQKFADLPLSQIRVPRDLMIESGKPS